MRNNNNPLVDCNGEPLVDIDGNEYTKLVYNNNGTPNIAKIGDPNGQIIKRFYEASFGGSDIRNFFWSTLAGPGERLRTIGLPHFSIAFLISLISEK